MGLRQTVAEACQWSLQRREKLDKLNDQARCWQTLTSEEQVIIELAMQGAPNKAISSQLGLSLRTIESRRQGILRHFGVRTLTELACLLARYRSRESSRRALPGHPAWLVDAAHRPRPQG